MPIGYDTDNIRIGGILLCAANGVINSHIRIHDIFDTNNSTAAEIAAEISAATTH